MDEKVIAWDTSTRSGAIVAFTRTTQGPVIHCEWRLDLTHQQHSERLLWSIHETLEACRWKIEDVHVFAVGAGPGSFTGLRIGVTTAKTLAAFSLGEKKRLISFSSLLALSQPAAKVLSQIHPQTLLIASTDAAKNELFHLHGTSLEISQSARKIKRGVKTGNHSPEKLLKILEKKLLPRQKWATIGNGSNLYHQKLWDMLPAKRRIILDQPMFQSIQPSAIAVLVANILNEHPQDENSATLVPNYARLSEAERKMLEK